MLEGQSEDTITSHTYTYQALTKSVHSLTHTKKPAKVYLMFNQGALIGPMANQTSCGYMTFTVTAPRLWNQLSLHFITSKNTKHFKN